jgi:hypothetical protein
MAGWPAPREPRVAHRWSRSRASHQLRSCAGDHGAVKTRPAGAESNSVDVAGHTGVASLEPGYAITVAIPNMGLTLGEIFYLEAG